MGVLSWIVFGALAGWAANAITGNRSRGCLTNVLIGIVGAFLGGLIMSLLGRGHHMRFDLESFAVAVVGAVVLLAITGRRIR